MEGMQQRGNGTACASKNAPGKSRCNSGTLGSQMPAAPKGPANTGGNTHAQTAGCRIRRLRRARCRPRSGAVLSGQAGEADRDLSARRQLGSSGTRVRPEAVRSMGTAGDRREQARSGGLDRHGLRGQAGERRLQLRRRQHRAGRGESAAIEGALRRGARLRGDFPDCARAQYSHRQPGRPGQVVARADRSCQVELGHAQLRHIQYIFSDSLPAMQFIKAGRARALCVTGAERSPITPELPPCAEAVPGLVAVNWWGVFMPAGTPKAVTEKFHTDLVKAIQDAEVKKKFADLGVEAVYSTPEQFVAFMKSETAKYAKLIKEAGIKVE